MNLVYSLHQIENATQIPFSEAAYSRFKFGDGEAAKAFGSELGKAFAQQNQQLLLNQPQIVVLASPFSGIPTASFFMKNAFVKMLNRFLALHGKPVAEECKIYRDTTYRIDYGNLSAEERLALIGRDSFYTDKQYLANKFLIFIDDIRITGSHQTVIERMMQSLGMHNPHCFVYFAELTNKSIHPSIENYLNYFQVKSLDDMRSFIFNCHFCFNTRVVKFLLAADTAMLNSLLENSPAGFVENLADWAISNSYHTMEEYQHNFNFIITILNKNDFYGNQLTKGTKREPKCS
jgi:hypothetical protein